MSHTPEPWTSVNDDRFTEVRAAGVTTPIVKWAGFDDSFRPLTEHRANAARIVACVNAMQGIESPAAFVEQVRRVLEWSQEVAISDRRPAATGNFIAVINALLAQIGGA